MRRRRGVASTGVRVDDAFAVVFPAGARTMRDVGAGVGADITLPLGASPQRRRYSTESTPASSWSPP